MNSTYFDALAFNKELGGTRGIDAALKEHNLDALVLPAQGFTTVPAGKQTSHKHSRFSHSNCPLSLCSDCRVPHRHRYVLIPLPLLASINPIYSSPRLLPQQRNHRPRRPRNSLPSPRRPLRALLPRDSFQRNATHQFRICLRTKDSD